MQKIAPTPVLFPGLLLVPFLIAAVAVDVTPETLSGFLSSYYEKRVEQNYRHETAEESAERMGWIANGITEACTEFPFDSKLGWTFNKCVAISTTFALWESGLIKEVHEGTKKGPAGELCLFQLHRFIRMVPDPVYRVTEEERQATVGLSREATHKCAFAGVKTIAWHIHRCRLRGGDILSPSILFEQYHRPKTPCAPDFGTMSSRRASSYRALLYKLERKGL